MGYALYALLIIVAWAISFRHREARTIGLVLFMVGLTALYGASVAGLLPRVLIIALALIWYLGIGNGTRLRLYAMTQAEDELNDRLRSISQRIREQGTRDGLVSRPDDYDDMLRELDTLVAPDGRWKRVIRLTKAYLQALPGSSKDAVPKVDLWAYLAWQMTWYQTHDRRILFARRPDPRTDFEIDLRLATHEFYQRLNADDADGAAAVLTSVEQMSPPAPAWARVRETTVNLLRADSDRRLPGADATANERFLIAESEADKAWLATP